MNLLVVIVHNGDNDSMNTEDYIAVWIRKIKGEVEGFWRTTFNYIIIVDLDNYRGFLNHLLCVDKV